MRKFLIKCPVNKEVSGSIFLTYSKSISNRVLIIKALSKNKFNIYNLSNSEDTKILDNFLKNQDKIIDVDNAGTVARFLTSYLSIQDGKEFILKGSKRMSERPIKELVDVLKSLGAEIKYLKKEGFLPLNIKGKNLKGGSIQILGNISSQFISSLILIAPILENGLKIKINSKIVSETYINMTLEIIKYFGIKYKFENNIIEINKQDYISKDFYVEGDWSSASYFFSIASFSNNCNLEINNLSLNNLQGDSIILKISEEFGLKNEYKNNILKISKDKDYIKNDNFYFDFKNYPDIAQTVAVMCLNKKGYSKLTGLKTLKIKETDRIKAICNELSKLGIKIIYDNDKIEIFSGNINNINKEQTIEFETYNDHRMAMSLVPLSLLLNSIVIKNPDVVGKSYPNFWNDLKKIGFIIKEIE
jgi:3-phosphoshikimate 1-carboxyvinyltransferase